MVLLESVGGEKCVLSGGGVIQKSLELSLFGFLHVDVWYGGVGCVLAVGFWWWWFGRLVLG